jgi:hypothetical protein
MYEILKFFILAEKKKKNVISCHFVAYGGTYGDIMFVIGTFWHITNKLTKKKPHFWPIFREIVMSQARLCKCRSQILGFSEVTNTAVTVQKCMRGLLEASVLFHVVAYFSFLGQERGLFFIFRRM